MIRYKDTESIIAWCVDKFKDMPDVEKNFLTEIYGLNGEEEKSYLDVSRLEEVSIEDVRNFEHNGITWLGKRVLEVLCNLGDIRKYE